MSYGKRLLPIRHRADKTYTERPSWQKTTRPPLLIPNLLPQKSFVPIRYTIESPSVPVSLIELSSQIIMHKFNSPAWLKHIQKANAALGELTSDKMSHLGTGEAYVWSSKASDDAFTRGAVKINCRPRITQHGGSTKTAVGR